MNVLAVDLAAKYSAACLLNPDGQVAWQTDTWDVAERDFIRRITWFWSVPDWWNNERPEPDFLVVEDLPHRLPFSGLVRKVCRIQGRIIQAMDDLGQLHRLLFVPPAAWRKHFPGLERGTGPDAVVPVAASLGYTPPDLTDRIALAGDRAEHRKIARKVRTDYAAAYLIARWAADTHAAQHTLDTPETSRYPD